MGRPTKCTPELTDTLCKLVRDGMGREAAARTVGIDAATFCRWMQKGQRNIKPYREFRRRVEAASDTLHKEVSDVLVGQGLRSDNPDRAVKIATWLAERLWPDVYGRRQELRHSGPDGGPVAVAAQVTASAIPLGELARMSPEQLRALGEGIEAAQAKDEEGR